MCVPFVFFVCVRNFVICMDEACVTDRATALVFLCVRASIGNFESQSEQEREEG